MLFRLRRLIALRRPSTLRRLSTLGRPITQRQPTRPRYSAVLVVMALAAASLVMPLASPAAARSGGTAKIMSGPTIISSPADGDTYRRGETISMRVVFDKPVRVTGNPRLRAMIGDERHRLRYTGSGEERFRVWSEFLQEWLSMPSTSAGGLLNSLVFSMSVKADDVDADGISVGRNQIRLNGARITDADGKAANVAHGALAAQSAHKVDGRSNTETNKPGGGNGNSGNGNSGNGNSGGDGNGNSGGDGNSGGGPYLAPETPAGVKVTVSGGSDPAVSFDKSSGETWRRPTTDGTTAVVSWDAPAKPRNVTRYQVQWRWVGEEFDGARSAALKPADATSGRLSYTLPDRTYKVRVIAEGPAGTAESSVVLVPTDESLIFEAIERLVIARYHDEQRWIRETWKHITTNKDFKVKTATTSYWAVHVRGEGLGWSSVPLPYLVSLGMDVGVTGIEYADAYLHEMAHVWTLGHGVASKPGPVGVGLLYFERVAREASKRQNLTNCQAAELYADTLNALTPVGKDTWPINSYWRRCGMDGPGKEGLDVVRSVSAGEMPDWLYSANDDGNGNLDLSKLWNDVTEFGKYRPKARTDFDRATAVYQLKDSFGGYCSVPQARASAEGRTAGITNPWRDGGCTPGAPGNVTASPGSGSLTVSWDKPAKTGVSEIDSYVVQYKLRRERYRTKRQITVDGDTTTAVIPGLRNGRKYDVQVIAVNLLDDHDSATRRDGWSEPSAEATAKLPATR